MIAEQIDYSERKPSWSYDIESGSKFMIGVSLSSAPGNHLFWEGEKDHP